MSEKQPIEEKEILPGVYLTDFRKKSSSSSSSAAASSSLTDMTQVSILDLQELQNKMYHLRRSNQEMQEFDPEAKDDVIQESIRENEVLLAEYEQQEKLMKLQLEMISKHIVQ